MGADKTKKKLDEVLARCTELEILAAERDQLVESLQLEVSTLNASIKQILAAHKHELMELTAHLEGRTRPNSPSAFSVSSVAVGDDAIGGGGGDGETGDGGDDGR